MLRVKKICKSIGDLALKENVAVSKDFHLCAPFDSTVLDQAAGHSAQAADVEQPANFGHSDSFFPNLRRQKSFESVLHVLNHLIDNAV